MTNSGTVDVHIDLFEYTNAILFSSRHSTKPEVRYIGILLSHSHAHYIGLLVTVLFFFLVDMFQCLCDLVTYVWLDDDGCRHTERALRISLHHRRSKSHSRAI